MTLTILMSEAFRRTEGIGSDAGVYDHVQDVWYMLPDAVYFYRPDFRPPEKELPEYSFLDE